MSVIATAVKHLMAAGITGDALLSAIAELEVQLVCGQPVEVRDAQAERRRAADRERKAAKREVERLRKSAEVCGQSADTAEQKGFDKEKSPTPPKEITSKKEPIPVREGLKPEADLAFEAWNDLADECKLPKAQILNDTRRRQIDARLNECGGLIGWQDALGKIRGSPFLRGDNREGWRADLDFVLQRKSFTKLMEGSYDQRQGRSGRVEAGGKLSRADTWAIADPLIDEAIRRAGGNSEEGDEADNGELPGLRKSAA